MSDPDIDDEHDPELNKEFVKLRSEINHQLRRGDHVPDAQYLRRGQWLILPSFENPCSWDILGSIAENFTLFRTCWRFDLDHEAFESRSRRSKFPTPFKPTIETTKVAMPSTRISDLLAQFRSISIPVGLVNPEFGLDGTSFELLIGNWGAECRLSWWGNLPAEWRPMQPLVEQLDLELERAWETHSQMQGVVYHAKTAAVAKPRPTSAHD